MNDDHMKNYNINGRISYSESDRDWKVVIEIGGKIVREAAAKTPAEAISTLATFLTREMRMLAVAENMVSGWEAQAFGLGDLDAEE